MAKNKKFNIPWRKIFDYLKLLLGVIIIYLLTLLWKSYDYINIPYENTQMSPTFEPLESYIGYRNIGFKNLKYGDVVYYKYFHPKAKDRKKCLLFGRVIGLPGDLIEFKDGKVYRNGEYLEEDYIDSKNFFKESHPSIIIPKDHLYLLIDNRKKVKKVPFNFKDSRFLGPIPIYFIEGKINKKED